MKNTTIYKNDEAINETKAALNKAVTDTNALLNVFTKLGLPFKIKEAGQLRALCQHPDSFILAELQKAETSPLSVFGINISKTKAVGLLDLEPLKELAFGVGRLQSTFGRFFKHSDNSVSVNKDAFDTIEAENSITVESPAQIAIHKAHTEFVEALKTFDAEVKRLNGVGVLTHATKETLHPFVLCVDEQTKLNTRIYIDNKYKFQSL